MVLFEVKSVKEAVNIIEENINITDKGFEEVDLFEAAGRVVYSEVQATEDVPAFNRSTVDGYAVIAKDTFGAGEVVPAILEVIGEVRMGEKTELKISPGQAVRISTGGMLPENSDAVVMLEYTHPLDDKTLLIEKPVAPFENVIKKGEDIATGEVLFRKGHTLRTQDVGALAALGITRVKVFKKPKIGIISSGDEVKEPDEKVDMGEIRDVNTYTLFSALKALGAVGIPLGIVRDDFDQIKNTLKLALENCDAVIISGGSSVGTRDLTLKAINSLGEPGLIFHGLSVKPGKPTIFAAVKGIPILGLPGHPVSALVIFELIGRPLVNLLMGRDKDYGVYEILAKCDKDLSSAAGREDYIRVRLEKREDELWAVPVLGKSGMICTMSKSDGLLKIPPERVGISKGEMVEVILLK
ncbi:gephyrin-like molybdotransferase Glp [Thermovenabulum gondwanense]|uniref:Molybdopterin molybdenumtransferase n=1 Tax=Thermovenabulum gondwanense TaxID=520767 RepID=A0A162MWB6_9FIRM|nr:gephyrin-like molybdotransferase Glp [Thermovenabulum gondwanense]KYO68004.1 Molybdopterin molybdenumtransferase [Thermovenabulum gondwanense]